MSANDSTSEPGEIRFRPAVVEDGAEMWRVARDSGGLELNTTYAYLLLASHFADTSVVAETEGKVVGFVGAYRPPRKPDVIFVWQIGVDGEMRGRSVGKRLLHHLVGLPACKDVRMMETTVTPSNTASQRLFKGFARERGAQVEVGTGYPAELFKYEDHEAEDLFRIGPWES